MKWLKSFLENLGNYFIRTGDWVEEDRFNLIKNTPLFQDLPSYQYRQISDLFHESKYSEGERIFTHGDPATALYLIEEGSIRLFLEDREEKKYDVAIFEEGTFFGELALCPNHRRTTSAEAAEDSILLGLFKQELNEFLQRESDAGITILMNMVELLNSRLDAANEEIEELKQKIEEISQ